MLSATKTAFNTASSAGLLPAFGWVLLVVMALSAGATGWAVHRWDKGAQALRDNAQLRADRAAAEKAYDDLLHKATKREQERVDDSLAYRQAAERMNTIAAQLERDRESNRTFFDAQRASLGALLRDRPDLRELHFGDDVLRHWNESNAGHAAGGAAGAAARPAGQPAPAVPGPAAGAQRPGAGSAGQPRRGREALPRLQKQQRIAAVGDRRVAGHRMAVVLHRGRSARPRRGAMPA